MKISFYQQALDDWLKGIAYYSEIDITLGAFFQTHQKRNPDYWKSRDF